MPTKQELANKKSEGFDKVFCEIAAIRVIHYLKIRTTNDRKRLIPKIATIVEGTINPLVIEEICSPQGTFVFEKPARRRRAVYVPEDDLRLEIRKLVEYYHGFEDSIRNRRVINSCIALVANVANDDDFSDRIHAAARQELRKR